MAKRSDNSGLAAVWVTVLVVIGIAVGVYFAWPVTFAYLDNLTVRQAVRAKSTRCLSGGEWQEKCIQEMLNDIRSETSLQLTSDNLRVTFNNGTKINIKVSYRAKMIYPLTGTMLGMKKDRFWPYNYTVSTERKYAM